MSFTAGTPRRTPLHRLHEALGARLVTFAGYSLPVQYPSGILKEHTHTRAQAGLFDVSHMGQIRLGGHDTAAALESLMPIDVLGLAPQRQCYGFFTNEAGGILDDLMVTNFGDFFLLVVNAACKEQDTTHLRRHLASTCAVEVLDRALLALQGPAAAEVLSRLAPRIASMVFMDSVPMKLLGSDCYVSRSGYTGEDGFEISVAPADAETLARALLDEPEVAPVGLGARDSLRLEAGLCLYGQDLDPTTSPVEAGLSWTLSKARRADGARPGGYPGAPVVLEQLATGVARQRVALLPQSRIPVRAGTQLLGKDDERVGIVTSGGFGPTLGAPVAMGYVASPCARIGTELSAIVRDKRVPVRVAMLPVVPHRYRRR